MATSIQDVRSSERAPQRAYEWEVKINASNNVGQLELLTARAQNIQIPEKSVETIEINYKSRKARYAGRDASPGTFTVQFWDDESNAVYNYFNQWLEESISNSESGGGKTRKDYAVELVAELLAHDGASVTGTHTFKDVWVQSLGDITLDYSASEHVSFSVTFTYDTHKYSKA